MTPHQETALLNILEEGLSKAERLAQQVNGLSIQEAETRHDAIKTEVYKQILELLQEK